MLQSVTFDVIRHNMFVIYYNKSLHPIVTKCNIIVVADNFLLYFCNIL